MKKIILLTMAVFMLTGCHSVATLEIDNWVDKETCVEYLTRYQGGISPMYNPDGTMKLNKECLNGK